MMDDLMKRKNGISQMMGPKSKEIMSISITMGGPKGKMPPLPSMLGDEDEDEDEGSPLDKIFKNSRIMGGDKPFKSIEKVGEIEDDEDDDEEDTVTTANKDAKSMLDKLLRKK